MEPDPNKNRGPFCKVCGVEKTPKNYWFKVLPIPGEFTCVELADLRPGDPVCGAPHAVQLFSEWLSRRAFEDPGKGKKTEP